MRRRKGSKLQIFLSASTKRIREDQEGDPRRTDETKPIIIINH